MQAGRFTSVDAFSGYMNYPSSMNPYQYAYNNPLKYVDPSGNIAVNALQWVQVGMDVYSMVSQYADRNCTTVEQLTRNVLAGVASFVVGFIVGAIIGTAGVLAFGPGLLAAVFVGAVGSVVAGQWARAVSNLILGKPWDEGLMKREDILTDFVLGIFGEVVGFGFAKLVKTVKALRIAGGSVDDIVKSIDEVLPCKGGEFCILDWSDYPEGLPQPEGPFRILPDDEYNLVRELADKENARLHRSDSSYDGFDLHEIHPVKFGGDPISINNKIPLPRSVHAKYTTWWNKLQRSIENAGPFINFE